MNAPATTTRPVSAPGHTAGGVSPWRHRLDVAARTLAAAAMGYLVAALSAATLSRLLPGPTPEAIMTGSLLSFAIYAGIAIWAFAERQVWRVWLGLSGAAAVLGAILWLSLRLEPIT